MRLRSKIDYISVIVMAADPDKVAVVEAVIFYHADPESGNNKFAGTKERVRIGIKKSHQNLNAFTRYVTSFCGIKAECVKRGLGESFEVRLCRLVKDSTSQPKAFSINTQEQWDLEMPIFTDSTSSSLLQGTLFDLFFMTFYKDYKVYKSHKVLVPRPSDR